MSDNRIGITTTIPLEVVYAAGCVPVDLNNIFISNPERADWVARAEVEGFPITTCAWVKGIYTAVGKAGIHRVIAVVQGDCSDTQALMEALSLQGVEVIPFGYPYNRDQPLLRLQIERLADALGTTWEAAHEMKRRLDEVRRVIARIDELTWKDGKVTGWENHLYDVSCSDMNQDIDKFEAQAKRFVVEAERRHSRTEQVLRIGMAGVPPIFDDLHDYVESLGAVVVFNEVSRQFAMPYATSDLVEQYSRFTYPYDIFARIEDIRAEAERRGIDGLIHYTQAFCFRQLQDLILRRRLSLPILTLEGDRPLPLSATTKVRLEAFVDMLAARKAKQGSTVARSGKARSDEER